MKLKPKHIILFAVLTVVGAKSVSAQYILQLTSQFQPTTISTDTVFSESLLKTYPKLSFYLPSEDIHLGVACKIENKQYYFEKKKFNYRMRLGNLDYVNYLEGKTKNY